MLKGEGLLVSFASVTKIIKEVRLTGSVANLPRSGRPTKLSLEANAFIDQQMQSNDEMTSAQIQKKLAKHGITVRRSHKKQGWTLQWTAYCQLIRRDNLPPLQNCYVCSEHFTDDCFETDLKSQLMPELKIKRCLKRNGTPSVFSFGPEPKKPRITSENHESWQRAEELRQVVSV